MKWRGSAPFFIIPTIRLSTFAKGFFLALVWLKLYIVIGRMKDK